MLKELLQRLIRRKAPHFSWDEAITMSQILSLSWMKLFAWWRGWRLLLYGRVPQMLFLGRGVRFFHLSNIRFGKWVQLDDYVFVSALSRRPVSFGHNVHIGAFSRIVAATSFNNVGSYIRIGNNVGIGEYAYLGGGGGLEIGDECIIGQYLSCHPENHVFTRADKPIRLQGVTRKGIRIGHNCWIGSKVTILDGVTIGDNCVVAAGAVVTRSMPPNSLIAGVPARVIRPLHEGEHPSQQPKEMKAQTKSAFLEAAR